ncbi:MAG: hypothetical protein K1Y02_11370 [Candidatus Hydrogenedentes bacterium]|nr:hypothetical protein [Candidatus Hydrogenedentota bacterium]
MQVNRRVFLKTAAIAAGVVILPEAYAHETSQGLSILHRRKQPGLVRGAYFYPSQELVESGQCEDSWSVHNWSTWPGNQFKPEEQQAKFNRELDRISEGLDLTLKLDEKAIFTDAGVTAFIEDIKKNPPEALLLINFWNTFSKKIMPILEAYSGPIILYHAVGANHQLPPEQFRTAKHVQYIHSIENWDAIERGLRCVNAKVRMRQSKLLRVSGKVDQEIDEREAFFDMLVHTIPAGHFNDLFDSIEVTRDMRQLAASVRRKAGSVSDLSEKAFFDAVRAHAAVLGLLQRHDADAITIECLFLQHRKPCLSFSINNGALIPCGCENDLNATLTLMLGANLFHCGGFQHNPEFDTEENLYFGAHCTCATRLHGPEQRERPYDLRPFFHQLPKTLALDVQWPEDEPVTLCKYHSGEKRVDAWDGCVVSSPSCPPTGGCATRVLVKLDNVADVCTVYPGPHPVLYCGKHAKHLKTFAALYELDLRSNA